MSHHARLLAGIAGLAILLAACGGSGSASPAASSATAVPAAPTDGGTATEAPEMTEEPEATEAPDTTTDPETVNDLASLLPEEANGVKYERTGFDGDQLGLMGAAAGLDADAFGTVLEANGKTLNDINFAIATPADAGAGGMIYAVQVEGVPAMKWFAEMDSGLDTTNAVTLGGKEVYGEAAGDFGAFVYPKDDTVFMLVFVDEATAAAILEQLP